MQYLDYVLINSLHDLTIAWEGNNITHRFYVACVLAIRDALTTIYMRDELTVWLATCDSLLTDRCETWMMDLNPDEVTR